MARKVWVYDPQSGGQKIPANVEAEVRQRLLDYAEDKYCNIKDLDRIDVRFRNQFCYIDSYYEPPEINENTLLFEGETNEEYIERIRNTPSPLCRLRYFPLRGWSLAIYSYSHEKYEPAIFSNGKWEGTPEEALDMVMRMYYSDTLGF